MNKFNIGYFADGPWSHKAFELLQEDKSLNICFIVPRIDSSDETLKNFAVKHNIDYFKTDDVNSKEFKSKARFYDCDLFVSMSFNQIFKREIIEIPNLNTINCHAGKLPFYRGRNVLNWAIINDEKEFGITVHFVEEVIDTGDIILQETYPILEEDDYGSILKKAFEGCARLLYDSVKKLQEGNYKRIEQHTIHPIGFYCGGRKLGDEIIDWDNTSREIFNFIRALANPGPKATTFKNGKVVKINSSRLIKNAPSYKNIPGQILKKTENGFIVKTKDTFIEIQEIKTEVSLKIGDRFETGTLNR